jgi:mono/diheme cytochrome c family protein
MSIPRHVLIWIIAATATTLFLIGILLWRQRSFSEHWNTFLVGDPRVGAQTFQEKGCGVCHAILGAGPTIGPDLGLLGAKGVSNMNDLATQMWDHAPRMWEQIKRTGVAYPRFTAEDMADLFAYLYVTCYDDEPGNTVRGEALFSQKDCIRCHAIGGKGGQIGPDLRDVGPVVTPIFWAQAMWNHAPAMESHMRALNIRWPQFQGEEMNDLLAFVRQARGGSEMESELLPANPSRGWDLFQKKGCIACHAIRGSGGKVGPDLGLEPLPRTLTQVASLMWNHSPEMWAAMKAKGIERPTFAGQEMADIIAFLYSVRPSDIGGSPVIGQHLFNERKCSQCHGTDARGGGIGPDLRKGDTLWTPVTLALALWSHGPHMYAKAQELGLGWPTLNAGDLSHLLAFLNSHPTGKPSEAKSKL